MSNEIQQHGSLADAVYERLENDILCGVYPPGELLSELHLCRLLDVSRTPVREALKRLAQEGLMEETSRGMTVIGITEKDIEDIYEIRARIEGLATRLCVGTMTDRNLSELRDIVELQAFYTERATPEQIRDTDSAFHSLIYRYCGNRTLTHLLTTLHHRVQRYRQLSVVSPERAKSAVTEHRGIYEALVARDAEQAEALAVAHVRNAQKSILHLENPRRS